MGTYQLQLLQEFYFQDKRTRHNYSLHHLLLLMDQLFLVLEPLTCQLYNLCK